MFLQSALRRPAIGIPVQSGTAHPETLSDLEDHIARLAQLRDRMVRDRVVQISNDFYSEIRRHRMRGAGWLSSPGMWLARIRFRIARRYALTPVCIRSLSTERAARLIEEVQSIKR